MAKTQYDNIADYLMNCPESIAKADKFRNLITALEDQMILNASGQELDSYEWDDGQSRIKTVIKDFKKVAATIDVLTVQLKRIENENIGFIHANRDAKAIQSYK